MKRVEPVIIGVAGGTGAGKTTLVRHLVAEIGVDHLLVIQHDAYYADQSHLTPEQRSKLNYDHPDALETSLLTAHVRALARGRAVEIPVYDFATHARRKETRRAEARDVIVVDGILCLADRALRQMMDLRLFVEAPDDIRFIRRLRRDLAERARTPESVMDQYLESVRRMHLEFVEPSKRHADLIVPEGGQNRAAIEAIVERIGELRKAPRGRSAG
jgi:uridine kinase